MIIILREPLNSNETLVSHSFTELNMFVRCSVGKHKNIGSRELKGDNYV